MLDVLTKNMPQNELRPILHSARKQLVVFTGQLRVLALVPFLQNGLRVGNGGER